MCSHSYLPPHITWSEGKRSLASYRPAFNKLELLLFKVSFSSILTSGENCKTIGNIFSVAWQGWSTFNANCSLWNSNDLKKENRNEVWQNQKKLSEEIYFTSDYHLKKKKKKKEHFLKILDFPNTKQSDFWNTKD